MSYAPTSYCTVALEKEGEKRKKGVGGGRTVHGLQCLCRLVQYSTVVPRRLISL